MNDVVGDNVELEELPQGPNTDRREEIENKMLGKLLECVVGGHEGSDGWGAFKLGLLHIAMLVVHPAPVKTICKVNLLDGRALY